MYTDKTFGEIWVLDSSGRKVPQSDEKYNISGNSEFYDDGR
jgi:hypothetical protein